MMWIKNSARFIKNLIVKISEGGGIVCMIFLMLMMLLMVVDVALRFAFNTPINGVLELVEFLMLITGFLGMAWCAVHDGHVKVDLIVSHFPPRLQNIIDALTILMGLTVIPLAAWQGFIQIHKVYLAKTVSDALEIPNYPFYGVVGLGFALLSLVMIIKCIELIAKAVKR